MIRERRYFSYLLLLSFASTLLIIGCDSDSIAPDQEYDTIRYFWQGSYVKSISVGDPDHGSLVIDALCTGTEIMAELVFQSYMDRDLKNHMYMRGSLIEGELSLTLDTSVIAYQYEATLEGSVGPDSALTGTFMYPDLVAAIECVYHTVDTLEVESSVQLPGRVRAIASHQAEIWLSYDSPFTNGYLRMDGDGDLLDTTVVTTETGALFISNHLTSDGTYVWGSLPASVSSQGSVTSGILLISFDEEGEIIDDFFVPTKASGIASTPTESWLVHSHTNAMMRYDDSGAILDSIPVLIPDLVHLDYDGTRFWSLGWYMRRLYEIDTSGEVIAVFDIPPGPWDYMLSGLVCDGTYVWYSHTHYTYGSFVCKAHIPDGS